MPKSVLILAGGFGTRLKAEFPSKPKPLIEVNGTPILHHCVSECLKYGFSDILISTHHQSEMIRDSIRTSHYNYIANIDFINEPDPMGTGGALQLSVPHMRDNFLVLYADIYSDVNLSNVMDFHCHENADFTTVVHPNNHPYDSDIVVFDAGSNIVRNIKSHKERSANEILPNMVNAAQYVVNKSVIPESIRKWDIAQDLLPYLLDGGKRILAYETLEYLKDMGSPDRLTQVENDVLSGKVASRNIETRKKAIFFDRDGCLNKHMDHINNPKDLTIEDNVPSALSRVNNSDFVSFCVTNQPVVARGELTEEGLQYIHWKLQTELGRKGAFLDGIIYCPHHPHSGFKGENVSLKVNCECRKPKPGMINSLNNSWNLDLENSWVIGDTLRDIGAGHAAGCWTVLLSSGDPRKEFDTLVNPPDFIFSDVATAIDFILGPFNSLYKVADQVAEQILACHKINIALSGPSRSGKSTFASLLKRALCLKSRTVDIFSTDAFLKASETNHSRVFDDALAKRALSSLDRQLISCLRNRFHMHETGDYYACKQLDLTDDQVLILEGEDIPYVNNQDIFHIRISTHEDTIFERFEKKYSMRGLGLEQINDLYSSRKNKKARYPSKINLEVKL